MRWMRCAAALAVLLWAGCAAADPIQGQGPGYGLPKAVLPLGGTEQMVLTQVQNGRNISVRISVLDLLTSISANVGSVTSVAQTVPAEFTITGSPITTAGTLAIDKAPQNANLVWAGPTAPGPAKPTFRALVAADLTAVSISLSMPSEFSVAGSPAGPAGTFTVTKANQSANRIYAGPTSGGAAAPAFRALVTADLPTLLCATISNAGTACTANTGTSGATLPFLNGTNTFSGTQTFGTVVGTVTTQSGTTYTLASTDCGETISFTNGSAITVTVPNSLPVGCNIAMEQDGAGQITVSAGAGATARSPHSYTKSYAQYSIIGIAVITNSGGSSAVYAFVGDGNT